MPRSLLLCLLQSGLRADTQTTGDYRSLLNHHTPVRPSAPPAISNITPDPSAPPPFYHQLAASDQHDRSAIDEAQLMVAKFEDRGYSNNARLLANVFNDTIQYRDMQHLEQLLMVARYEDRGYSNTAHVLADVFNRNSRNQSG